jgi:hypothetical protein
MAKKTIENCTLIKMGIRDGIGYPGMIGDKCNGYAKYYCDEPHDSCIRCELFEGYKGGVGSE